MSPLADTAVIILAAGRGERFGDRKQFVEIDQKPMLWWSLDTVNELEAVAQIILVLPEDDISRVSEILGPYAVTTVVAGGKERTDSVRAALSELADEASVVLVHDAARPLATKELFSSVIDMARTHDAVLPCVNLNDTIKEVAGSRVVSTLDRTKLRAAQTPQGFSRGVITAAYSEALTSGSSGTDDASLVELFGADVTVIEGEDSNIKVTSPMDVEVVELIVNSKRRSQ